MRRSRLQVIRNRWQRLNATGTEKRGRLKCVAELVLRSQPPSAVAIAQPLFARYRALD